MIAVDTSASMAVSIDEPHGRWGRGVHPADLNFRDCFAYDAAEQHACPLLFVGADFSRTDIRSAL